MVLTYEQIKSITSGAVKIEQQEEGIQFHRFTEEQEKIYENSSYHPRQCITAGIRLCLETNSRHMYLKAKAIYGNSRKYFACDVLVNDELVGSLANFKLEENYINYASMEGTLGEYEKEFLLNEGTKRVCIHLPWSVCFLLQELRLDDGAFWEPVKKTKKMIAFGDSITQGYDALHPSNRYIAQIADMLNAEEICKAIAGETFCPQLAAIRDDFEPNYIVVAYGTNDWRKSSVEEFRRNCNQFFEELVQNYPNVQIFVITPIWRKERIIKTAFDSFDDIEKYICEVVKKYNNIICIVGRSFLPADENLYADLRLHPTDEGFKHYFQAVNKVIGSFKA